MLEALTAIFLCQLAGELVVAALGLPLPGPVIGMALLFAFLVIRGSVPQGLEQAATGLLSHLTLLFIPASVGVMVHFHRIEEDALSIGIAILVSTFATMIVAGWIMQAMTSKSRKDRA
ncbi:CidA/LrgA family protein [Consotaella salsifontis]|uniref:Holin-like protein n=1 Tax=Consotaella salsifontis TaxID=1365950 RepID=A0A1T4PR98_9HYPH|nr:CidA/LrgA family protein [Consotaella salsifontis]SJZ94164.1 holin-like protein [Consotaella salsifontis]